MWLVNETKNRLGVSFDEIFAAVGASEYEEIFDVNDETLVAPEDMAEAIGNLLEKSGKKKPENMGDLFNSIFHSLAFSYAEATREIEKNLGIEVSTLYIIGGGAKNDYLNGLTEKYTNKNVIPMPIEATALGNLKIQMRCKK